MRLFSRNGYDWTSRYPCIVEAARKIRQKRFVLDGEAVILGVDLRRRPSFLLAPSLGGAFFGRVS